MPDLSFSRNSSNRSVSDILAESEALLKERPSTNKDYLTPCRNRVYYEFLGELIDGPLLHFYNKEEPPTHPGLKNFNLIRHSHSKNSGCFAPTFCYVVGYAPTGSEHPAFIRAFNQTWEKKEEYEKEVRNSPTGVSQQNDLSNVTFG